MEIKKIKNLKARNGTELICIGNEDWGTFFITENNGKWLEIAPHDNPCSGRVLFYEEAEKFWKIKI